MEAFRFAKTLRTNQTPWEKKLWKRLRADRFYGLRFKRQVMIDNIIVDFYCHKYKLVIEVYGNPHKDMVQQQKDLERINYLEKNGYQILKFWNGEIDRDLEGVLNKIKKFLAL